MIIADNLRAAIALGPMCINQCLRVDFEVRAR